MQQVTCERCGDKIKGMALQKADEVTDLNNNIIVSVRHVNTFSHNFNSDKKTYCSDKCFCKRIKPIAGLLPQPKPNLILMEYCEFIHPTKHLNVFIMTRNTMYHRERAYKSASLMTNGKLMVVNNVSLVN